MKLRHLISRWPAALLRMRDATATLNGHSSMQQRQRGWAQGLPPFPGEGEEEEEEEVLVVNVSFFTRWKPSSGQLHPRHPALDCCDYYCSSFDAGGH